MYRNSNLGRLGRHGDRHGRVIARSAANPCSCWPIDDELPLHVVLGEQPARCGLGSADLLDHVDLVVTVRIRRACGRSPGSRTAHRNQVLERSGCSGRPGRNRDAGPGPRLQRGAWLPGHSCAGRRAPRAARRSRIRPTSTRRALPQVTTIPADSDRQQTAVMVAGDGSVERADLLIEAFPQAGVRLAGNERYVTRHRLSFHRGGQCRPAARLPCSRRRHLARRRARQCR
jgi:hypothetical protein